MSGCKYKIGLFSLRDCKEPIVGHCAVCNRPVCKEHAKAKGTGYTCLECLADQTPKEDWDDDMSDVRTRRNVYQTSGFTGFYYGHSTRRYEHDDYAVFDSDADDRGFEGADYGDDESDDGGISPDDFLDS